MLKEECLVIYVVVIMKNCEVVLGELDVVNNISEVFDYKLIVLGVYCL